MLNYDPLTGLFTWRQKPQRRIKIGAPVGCITDSGYLRTSIDRHYYRLHRLAWLYVTGAWPAGDIDHIDGNRTNNAFANLRDVSRTINAQNKREALGHNKTSGVLGVSKKGTRWRARVYVNGKDHTTYHATVEEAQQAYIEAKRIRHPGNML